MDAFNTGRVFANGQEASVALNVFTQWRKHVSKTNRGVQNNTLTTKQNDFTLREACKS